MYNVHSLHCITNYIMYSNRHCQFFTQDLCERHEKGVLQDHQRAIAKMGQYKKKKMSATVSSSEVGGCKKCGSYFMYLNLAWSIMGNNYLNHESL